MHRIKLSIGLVVLLLGTININAEDKKLAQTGFQFLSVMSDARGTAMGSSLTSLENGSSALFFNPACMSHKENFMEISLSQNNWIAGIKHNQISGYINPAQNQYGIFGFMIQSVDYGEIENTVVWDNNDGFVNTGISNPSALVLGASYAKALSRKFAIGGILKYAMQDLGKAIATSQDVSENKIVKKYVQSTYVLDFGTHFKTGYKSLAFGVSLQNLAQEIRFEEEDLELPLTFNMGISMNVFDLLKQSPSQQSFWLSVDAVHPRSFPEYLKIGLEYDLNSLIYFRSGYITNHENSGMTAGFGLDLNNLIIDYAYTPQGVFDQFNVIQQFTLRFAL